MHHSYFDVRPDELAAFFPRLKKKEKRFIYSGILGGKIHPAGYMNT